MIGDSARASLRQDGYVVDWVRTSHAADAALTAEEVEVDQLKSLVDKEDKRVAILVQRGKSKIFVPVNPG